MYWSEYFIPTAKETPSDTEAVSHQLLLRAGLVHMLTSGVYSYLPLGLRVLRKIENIIREEMAVAGASELLMSCLQPIELWKKSGRDQVMNDVMIKFQDSRKRTLCLGPTHEEVITQIVKDFVQSYRQLPVVLYQIQTKFRDELRTRFGIVRACEFVMKDAYSFDRDKKGLEKRYQLMYEAYHRIFKRCGLDTIVLEADSGAMGGDLSHEFLVEAPIGEDAIAVCPGCGLKVSVRENQDEGDLCPKCGKEKLTRRVAIELGHIFQLGTKYTESLGANFLDEDGKLKPIIMGCYGIGVSRLVAAVIESHNDAKGIIWPLEVAPFDVEILPLSASENDSQIMKFAQDLYDQLEREGLEVLLDDRNESAGKKFNDADLVGIPLRLTIGQRSFQENKVEIKFRENNAVLQVNKTEAAAKIKDFIYSHDHGI